MTRDEENKHAARVLEWIRRKDPIFNEELKDYPTVLVFSGWDVSSKNLQHTFMRSLLALLAFSSKEAALASPTIALPEITVC